VLGDLDPVRQLVAAAERRGVPVRHLALADARGRYGAEVVLVRPDQHIAWLGGRLSAHEADAVLDAVLRRGLLDDDATAEHAPITTRSDQ
jgi:hypothetical protein